MIIAPKYVFFYKNNNNSTPQLSTMPHLVSLLMLCIKQCHALINHNTVNTLNVNIMFNLCLMLPSVFIKSVKINSYIEGSNVHNLKSRKIKVNFLI